MTTPILRTSERKAFKRCSQRWWWSYREGLRPVGSEATPLWFGTGVHLALAEWYIPGTKRGIHPAETFTQFAGDALHTIKTEDKNASEDRIAQYEDGTSLGITLMEEYVKHWGTDQPWDFIQAEQTFSLDVPWPADDRQQIYTVDEESGLLVVYKGTYDGVYRDLTDGRIKLLETKTAKAISTAHLSLDDQAGSYWAVATHTLREAGKINPDEHISAINYNFIRKALPDDRPRDAAGYACNKPVKDDYARELGLEDVRKLKVPELEAMARSRGITVLGERSKVQPSPVFQREEINRTSAERKSQLRRIQDEAVAMQAHRDRLLPLTKNPTRDCTWDCSFFQLCELQERGGNWQDYKRVAFRVEDPYKDHRKSSDE